MQMCGHLRGNPTIIGCTVSLLSIAHRFLVQFHFTWRVTSRFLFQFHFTWNSIRIPINRNCWCSIHKSLMLCDIFVIVLESLYWHGWLINHFLACLYIFCEVVLKSFFCRTLCKVYHQPFRAVLFSLTKTEEMESPEQNSGFWPWCSDTTEGVLSVRWSGPAGLQSVLCNY